MLAVRDIVVDIQGSRVLRGVTFDVGEGEASIFRPDGKGGFTLVGRVQGADWPRLASP